MNEPLHRDLGYQTHNPRALDALRKDATHTQTKTTCSVKSDLLRHASCHVTCLAVLWCGALGLQWEAGYLCGGSAHHQVHRGEQSEHSGVQPGAFPDAADTQKPSARWSSARGKEDAVIHSGGFTEGWSAVLAGGTTVSPRALQRRHAVIPLLNEPPPRWSKISPNYNLRLKLRSHWLMIPPGIKLFHLKAIALKKINA